MDINYTFGDRVQVSRDHPQHRNEKGVVVWLGKYIVDVHLDNEETRTSFRRDQVNLITE